LTETLARKVDLLTWNSIQNPYFLNVIQRSHPPV